MNFSEISHQRLQPVVAYVWDTVNENFRPATADDFAGTGGGGGGSGISNAQLVACSGVLNNKIVLLSGMMTGMSGYFQGQINGLSLVNINDTNRFLLGEFGTTTLDWGNSLLKDSNSQNAVDWEARILYNGVGQAVLSWSSQSLYDSLGQLAANWDQRFLRDEWIVQAPTQDSGIANKAYVDNATPSSPVAVTKYAPGLRPAGYLFSRLGSGTYLAASTYDPTFTQGSWVTPSGAIGYIAFIGDSISAGTTDDDWYSKKVYRNISTGITLNYANFAKHTARLYNPDPLFDIPSLLKVGGFDSNFSRQKGINFVWAGTNDLFLGGFDGDVVWTRLKTLTSGLRAKRPFSKTIVVTTLPREGNGSFRLLYNQHIMSGDPTIDYVIDMASDPIMGYEGAEITGGYYDADQIHPNNRGQTYIAGPIQSGIDVILAQLFP